MSIPATANPWVTETTTTAVNPWKESENIVNVTSENPLLMDEGIDKDDAMFIGFLALSAGILMGIAFMVALLFHFQVLDGAHIVEILRDLVAVPFETIADVSNRIAEFITG